MYRYVLFLSLFAFLCSSATAQKAPKPVALTPLIGDTLYQADREYYHLLSKLDGFRWAVFYLNPDSSLRVQVNLLRGTTAMDTVIEHYTHLGSIRKHIATVDMIKHVNGDDPSEDNRQVINKYALKDGTVIQGREIKEQNDTVFVSTTNLGVLAIPKSQIKIPASNVEPESGFDTRFGTVDPNQTRTFLLPTATTLPSGGGYVADYELVFFNVAVGIGDRFMINGGMVLWPGLFEEEVFNFGFKLKLAEIGMNSFAVGAQWLSIPGNDGGTYGVGYGVFSRGDADRKFSIALGSAFNWSSGSTSNIYFAISGDSRISESVKLLFEAYYLGNFDDPHNTPFIPLIVGVRFFGNHVSGDLGLLIPLGESSGTSIGFPVVNIVYSF